eukprot:2993893-Pleurochrysis_carterae.AAC.1
MLESSPSDADGCSHTSELAGKGRLSEAQLTQFKAIMIDQSSQFQFYNADRKHKGQITNELVDRAERTGRTCSLHRLPFSPQSLQ